MDVKQAVKTAKDYVVSLYDEENVMDIGLEEVEFDICSDQWHVTIGFSRPWDKEKSVSISVSIFRCSASPALISKFA